jgi:septal ring factor EnvC (AmiA/AmiB activator)
MEKDDHAIEDKSEPDINTNSLNDEPMFSSMKSSLASLEGDFVLFKQTTQMSINDLTVQLDNKDDEISNLKTEITLLKTTNLSQQQSICDLNLKQSQIEDELKKLKNKHKSLEKKNTDLLQKLQTLNKENIQTNEETTSQIQPNITVPISNSFGTLEDNLNQPDEDEIQRDEMSTSQTTPKTNHLNPIK